MGVQGGLRDTWNSSTGSWSVSTISAEKIQPLADKIKEYILDHQDVVGAQEVVLRDMATSCREQREEMQTVQAGVQKVQEEVQSMQQRFDDVHLKLDETILLVRVLALESNHY